MSIILATSPRMPGEADTVEGRLADIMDFKHEVWVGRPGDGYRLSKQDLARVILALRRAAHL